MTKIEKQTIRKQYDRLWMELKEYEWYLATESGCTEYLQFSKLLASRQAYMCKLFAWSSVYDLALALNIDLWSEYDPDNECTRRANEAMDNIWNYFHK